jgi:hypothetical protein
MGWLILTQCLCHFPFSRTTLLAMRHGPAVIPFLKLEPPPEPTGAAYAARLMPSQYNTYIVIRIIPTNKANFCVL